MEEHPIEGLMLTAMDSIRDMIDVNTIIGEPMEVQDNVSIIPISKVCFGFAAGGSEFKGEAVKGYKKREDEEDISYKNPFGGGSGAAVSIKPVSFLVIQNGMVKLLPVEHNCTIDKILDYMPEMCEKAEKMMNKLMKKDDAELKENIKTQRPKIKKVDMNYKYEYDKSDEV